MITEIIVSGISMFFIDILFLSLNKNYFENQIKSVQNSNLQINLTGMISCYILLILGLYYFIIKEKRSITDAFLLGIFVYGVYETTNLSTLTNWKPLTVMMDTIWGGFLFASTTYITYKIMKYYT
jgi:uncharacterized membrane protein